MNNRNLLRTQWLTEALPNHPYTIEALPGDASFRNYFRIHTDNKNYLLMDAPPALESVDSFIAIADAYQKINIRTPIIFAQNTEQGFLLLEDFGTELLADVLGGGNPSVWYRRCYQELPKIQTCTKINGLPLPHFVDTLLMQELEQFKHWVIEQFAGLTLTSEEKHCLQKDLQQIKMVCADQPQVGVHRDYHSRNLMVLPNEGIGIIDFQDAVIGPLTYDLVSLLRDCYIDWPEGQVNVWLDDYYQSFANPSAYSRAQFQCWFDWQGLQRHLKALFIFCRKYLRDGSTNYLSAIPRTLRYAINESSAYPELAWLHQFLKTRLEKPLLRRITEIMQTAF